MTLQQAITAAAFKDAAHKQRFDQLRADIVIYGGGDPYRESLCYLLALSEDTYKHRTDLYDTTDGEIIPDGINKEWQTGTTLKLTRLAFNLFTGHCSWCDTDTERLCAVSDIFNCSYAPYFVEAVKIAMHDAF